MRFGDAAHSTGETQWKSELSNCRIQKLDRVPDRGIGHWARRRLNVKALSQALIEM